jgi:hypothetical protein
MHAIPSTGTSIQTALTEVHAASVSYWATFDTPTFLARIGDAWSPADNVRHLTSSMRAVTRGMRMPRLFLLLAFGRSTSPSRPYATVRDVYRARLAQGASAGRFAPRPRDATVDPEAERARIMSQHAMAVNALYDVVAQWPEAALDMRRLPHPLLGPLTVREMLLFTVYHNRHHLENVQRRLATRGLASATD